jgi:protein-disulfide isomerase
VRLAFRHLVVLGESSLRAAVAAEAAAQQGQFWPYHDRLYEAMARGEPNPYSDERLRAVASELNLNMTAFDAAFVNSATLQKVQTETEQARRQGIERTPTILVDNRRLVGALPYTDLQMVIEQSMAARGR